MSFIRFLALAALAATLWPLSTRGDEPKARAVEELAKDLKPSIVVITAKGRESARDTLGTGFIVSADGVIATNFHEVFSTPQMLESFKANTPAGRLGTSEETADVIAYLCSPQAAYIYGQTIEVNGGLYFA